jgi:hypothetical protein
MNILASRLKRREGGGFYTFSKESARWGVRDPDMSGLEAKHVRQTSLEPNRGTEQVRALALT